MDKCYRNMKFSVCKESTVTFDDVLNEFEAFTSFKLNSRELNQKIYYCGDHDPSDSSWEMVRCTLPSDDRGGKLFFEYLESGPVSEDPYLLENLHQSAYSDSEDCFFSGFGLDASLFQSCARICGFFFDIQLNVPLPLPLRVSLESITYNNNKKLPVNFLEVTDLLSPDDLNDPNRWKDCRHLFQARDIILDNFSHDMCSVMDSIPALESRLSY